MDTVLVRLGLSALFVTGVSAFAASSYEITLISSPDPRVLYVQPNGINDAGEVVGYVTPGGAETAFYFTEGTLYLIGGTLNTAGSAYSSGARAVNASGQIAGFGGLSGQTGFIFNPDGSYVQIGTLGGLGSVAAGINNLGQVVGSSGTTSAATHAFLYTGGPLIDLGTLGGSTSIANSINNSGEVVGYSDTANGDSHAFLYSNGTLTDLGTLGGATSQAYSINDNDAVVGQADTVTEAHAFLSTNGVMKDLGTLGGPISQASWINANGDIVGNSARADLTARAFLYRAGVMIDLNSLIDPASGWFLETATAINNAGQITGLGVYGGKQVGYLLTPSVDTAPPSISLQNVVPGPPEQAIFSVVDPAGLLSISTTASNATITVSPFNPGQTTPVTVTATKTDQSAGANVTIYAEDVAGNQASFDPAFVTVYGAGGAATASLSEVQPGEHVLTVTNGSPGLDNLSILVNQTTLVLPLRNGETRSVNLRAWMRAPSNSISFRGNGPANASASLVLRDATPKSRTQTRQPE